MQGEEGKRRDPEVLCIGQAVIDCITRGQEADRHRENVFRADRIELHVGGDAVNESIALSRMGHRAAIACGVGRDLAGNLLRGELARRGVDTSRIQVLDFLTTPIAQLIVHPDGGRHSVNSRATMLEGYVPDAAILWPMGEAPAAPAPVLAADVSACAGPCRGSFAPNPSGAFIPNEKCNPSREEGEMRIVSFASLFRAPLDRVDALRDLVLSAKKSGAIVSADTKLPTFREVGMEDMLDLFPSIDYIFPNEKEAAYYADRIWAALGKGRGGDPEIWHMASAFRAAGVKNVIIKAGPDGCYVDGQEGKFHLPALPVEVVDSTGAGDNFVAGFLSGILRGEDLHACAVRGRACAAECISRMGANEPA